MILGRTGSRSAFRIWAVLILALSLSVLSSQSWGACTQNSGRCSYDGYGCSSSYAEIHQVEDKICLGDRRTPSSCYSRCVTLTSTIVADMGGAYCSVDRWYVPYTTCSTQAEADSVRCALNPTAEGCVEEDVPSACEEQYEQCTALKGRWRKIASTATECASTCNTCGTADVAFRNNQIKICCDAGEAPPDSAVQCSMPVNSGTGMTWSVRADRHNEEAYSCGALTTADGEAIIENQERYQRFCEDGERYEEQPPCIEGVNCDSIPGSSSSSEGSSSSSWASEMMVLEGLYGVLDTIRDTLVKRLTPSTEQILTCLQTAGLCPGLGGGGSGDTTIVNVYGDSSALKVDTTLRTQIKPLMQDGLKNDTLTRSAVLGVGDKVDSLIDSSRKYLKRVADSVGAVNKSVENLPGGIAGSLDSAIMEGYNGVDTNGVSYGWLEAGDSLADSILGGSGYVGLNFAADSSMRDSLEALGYVCTDSNCCVGSECIEFDSQQSIEDSLNRMVSRMGDTIRQKNQDFYNDSVTSMFQEVKDSLYAFNPLGIFDSTIMSTLGASIPNSNVCPDHCSTFQVSIPFFFGMQNMTIDWGLCMGRAVFANGNVLSFLRFIIRIIVAVTCITAVMWNATRIRR